jgi:hypothetical protein
MASEDVARVHREAVIVEGHRDMFEMNYLAAKADALSQRGARR